MLLKMGFLMLAFVVGSVDFRIMLDRVLNRGLGCVFRALSCVVRRKMGLYVVVLTWVWVVEYMGIFVHRYCLYDPI
jgi:hypothetical protein